MDEADLWDIIAPARFQKVLQSYPDSISSKLTELDSLRYETLPALLSQRRKASNAHLTSTELVSLVEWKLSHGKFRPTLKTLAAQNSDAIVQEVTSAAFELFSGNEEPDVKVCLTQLTKLRGIGPATASLLLSVCLPDKAPFFSDELFRWCFWEDKPGARWDRPIKYTPKEYCELFARVKYLQIRFKTDYGFDCQAVDVEKVAYVLGNGALSGGNKTSDTAKVRKSNGKRSADGSQDVSRDLSSEKPTMKKVKRSSPTIVTRSLRSSTKTSMKPIA